MGISPPDQFESFCVGLDVAFYRDGPSTPKNGFDTLLDGAIDYGLEGLERSDLVILRDFLKSVMDGPNAADNLKKLWENTNPRVAFFSSPFAPTNQPGILHIFRKVTSAIEETLTHI